MENVTKAVEKNIDAVLPDKFGAILDDWTHGTEYYMALYACFELNGVRRCPLRSLAPIINGPDDSLNAESHVAALAAFLPFFAIAYTWRSEIELADVESVSKKLQTEDLTLLDARDLLDGLMEIQPSFNNYLVAPRADIVHSPDFESGAVKVLGGQSKRLSRAERTALQPFLKAEKAAEEATGEAEPTKIGFADRILKSASVARMVLRYERNRLTPLSLEMILFLKMNESYWDVTTVGACI
ncbi:Hypothetical protein PHPALM_20836 [Phytophthora palmivora]|uniref:Uncharacterized protein n=1 Tax=Phytophthora palmivora TaxID=4796 RepID=A0A2P4XDV6_9STRA|nr:Hypothetical protein PHPALM_20836 [Phytophthora palmivora]